MRSNSSRNISFIDLEFLNPLQFDQSTMFTGDEMTYFSKDYDIQLIKSTVFYVQENAQAKDSNKVL